VKSRVRLPGDIISRLRLHHAARALLHEVEHPILPVDPLFHEEIKIQEPVTDLKKLNSDKSPGDHAWPAENDKTLIILIKCCMPSLLFIYPSICIKDISFWCRAKIIVYFKSLLVDSFEQRITFYVAKGAHTWKCTSSGTFISSSTA